MTAKRTSARAPRTNEANRERALEILRALEARYPDAHCELHWTKPHELLFATILSAQCTDVAVNKATPALFAAFPSVPAFAAASAEEIEPYVRTLGFFRQKSKSIHQTAQALVERHGGEIPRTMEDLIALRGVARKTANVVLGNAFGLNEGIVVDTHVQRLAHRMGLSTQSDPVKIERDLMALFPRDRWCLLSHLLIFHGRRACKARGGLCATDAICQRFCSEAAPSRPSATRTSARKVSR